MAAGAVEVNVTTNNFKPCAVFDGVDDHLQQTSFEELDVSKAWTISCWYKRDLATDDMIIIGNVIASGNRIIINSTTDLRAGIYNGSYLPSNRVINPTNFIWNHVVLTHIASSTTAPTLYHNGAAATDSPVNPSSPGGGSNLFRVGIANDGLRPFNGGVADVQMWDRELTAAEVTQVYQGSPVTSGLIHRYKLADDYTDSVGSKNLTNSGSILSIRDDTIAADIKADRTTANDKYLMVGMPGGQVVSAVIEEAP